MGILIPPVSVLKPVLVYKITPFLSDIKTFFKNFLFPCFGIRNVYRNQKYGTLEPLARAHKDVFYRFMKNPDIDWRRAL